MIKLDVCESYANMERTAILERLEREHLLEKEERHDWIEKLLEKYDKT